MITRNKKLEIFENFIVDERFSSPKIELTSGGRFTFRDSSPGDIIREEEIRLADYMHYLHMHERTLKSWFRLKLVEMISPGKKIRKPKYQSVAEFFRNIKASIKELEMNEASIEFYNREIETAVNQGQTALVEILSSKRQRLLVEANMLEKGIVSYVSEEDVIKFFEKSKIGGKTLKLSWIKNYVRIIPQDVLEKKQKFDDLKIFDNYVILHFDKDGTSTSMTIAEKEKAKDPILFGVSQYSRKLFYVADWIDEHCDLTLDKFLEVLEMKESRKITQEFLEKSLHS